MMKKYSFTSVVEQQVRTWAEAGKPVSEINTLLNEQGVPMTYRILRAKMQKMKVPLHRAINNPNTVITAEVEKEIKEWVEEGATAADVYKRLLGRGIKISRQRVYQKLELMGTNPRSLKEKKIERRGASGYKDTGIVEFTRNHYDELEMKADLMQYSESMASFRDLCWKRFKQKKYNTTSTRHVWDVEFEDIYFPLICPVLGVKLDYSGKDGGRSEFAPSFDRLDPTLGYVRGNVVIMSWRANRLKNDGTSEEHRAIADFLDSYHETKDDVFSLNELYEYDEEDEPTPEFVAEQARRAELPKEYKKCNCCGEYKALKQYVGEGVTYSTCIPCREQDSYDKKGKKNSTNDFLLGVAWGNKATADFIKEFVATSKESSPSV